MLSTDEEVDGESFHQLSSSSDIEGQLQCKFTFGGKSKLQKLMASVCTRPSGVLVNNINDALLLVLFLVRCCHSPTAEIDLHKAVLGPAGSLE